MQPRFFNCGIDNICIDRYSITPLLAACTKELNHVDN